MLKLGQIEQEIFHGLYMMQQRRVRTSFRPVRSAGGSRGQDGTVTGKEAGCLNHIYGYIEPEEG